MVRYQQPCGLGQRTPAEGRCQTCTDSAAPLPAPAPVFVLALSRATDWTMGNSQSVVFGVCSEPLFTPVTLLQPGSLPSARRTARLAGEVQVRVLRSCNAASHAKVAWRAAVSSCWGLCPRQGTRAVWRAHAHMSPRSLNLGIK